ncbi:MAG: hypothetical protein MI974_26865 [Chitinophagales bacterium]|nr:hypothetical protein [Chitinophagales bacterium]
MSKSNAKIESFVVIIILAIGIIGAISIFKNSDDGLLSPEQGLEQTELTYELSSSY